MAQGSVAEPPGPRVDDPPRATAARSLRVAPSEREHRPRSARLEAATGREPSRLRDGSAVLLVVLGLLFAVAVFMPPEGLVIAPLHDLAALALGRLSFLLPVTLAAVGVGTIVAGMAPERVPWWRLSGLTLLLLATVPAVHLVGLPEGGSLARAQAAEGAGYLGHWLGSSLLSLFGGAGTAVALIGVAVLGLLLTLDITVVQAATWSLAAARVAGGRLVDRRAPGRFAAGASAAAPPASSAGPFRLPRVGLPSLTFSRPSMLPALLFGSGRRTTRPGARLPVRRLQPLEVPALPPAAAACPEVPATPVPLQEWQAWSRAVAEDQPPEPVTRERVAQPPGSDQGQRVEPPRVEVGAVARPRPAALVSSAFVSEPVPAIAPVVAPVPAGGTPADGWRLPEADVLQVKVQAERSGADVEARSRLIEETLATFNVDARVVEANQGPAVTQYGIEPGEGVPVSKILARQNDLALRLGASPLRMEAPIPGKSMVGLEVPNGDVATVTIRDVVDSETWSSLEGRLRLALGRDVSGRAIVGDLGKMPHLLIAGATGAGKSVCINTIVGSLLVQFKPDELQLLMIDPKRVELVGFAGIPHLRLPVVTDMEDVVGALKWVVQEMDRRYTLFARHGARNLDGFNRWAATAQHPDAEALPYLVVIIDELADMMMTAADDVEKTLCRLAQLARATGIHLVVATQRPSVDVLTGLIKANFPTRIAFAVSSQTDSRVILDQAGAEKLLGRGDALFMPPDVMKPVRLQGAFVSDEEIRLLVDHWKLQGGPRYTDADVEQIRQLGAGDDEDDGDLYERAEELAETVGRLSVSLLQRRLGIGKPKAQRLLDRLIDEGVAEGP
ncbi:MAG: DNA translocase FtsK [Chloroflexi bacterium]|nr:DNA translocase FtsK [Chloroflexota bacterium]